MDLEGLLRTQHAVAAFFSRRASDRLADPRRGDLFVLGQGDDFTPFGHCSADFPFCDALWTCSTMFSNWYADMRLFGTNHHGVVAAPVQRWPRDCALTLPPPPARSRWATSASFCSPTRTTPTRPIRTCASRASREPRFHRALHPRVSQSIALSDIYMRAHPGWARFARALPRPRTLWSSVSTSSSSR